MASSNPVSALTRRSFIKGTSAMLCAAMAGGGLLSTGMNCFVPSGVARAEGLGKWVKSYCSGCTYQNCGTEVKVVNGIAVELRGNTAHPCNQGTLCPRGAAQLMSTYNPYRVKTPLKRTNPEKGLDVDPGWVEISWDEAISTIAERLNALLADDPRKFIYAPGFAANILENPLAQAPSVNMVLHSPNIVASNGPLCEVHYAPASFNGSFLDRIDLNHCKYVVTFGRNLGGSTMFASGPGRALGDAVARGLKIVSVDPHCNQEASKGEWIPIRPATDLAMAFAMLNVILHELNEYDVDAMKFRSDAPYLIGPDGDYLRGANGKPMMWDAKDGTAKAFDDTTLADPALEGRFLVNGTYVSSAFMVLKAHVKSYTPEWAAAITDVPAETIRRITRELVDHACIGQTITIDGHKMPYRPACLAVGRGAANEFQGNAFYYMADVINLVVGAIGVPGSPVNSIPINFKVTDGLVDSRWVQADTKFSMPLKDYSGAAFFPRTTFGIPYYTIAAMIDPKKYYLDYELDTMFIYGNNLIMNNANGEDVVKALKKLKFIFSLSYDLDEMTLFSDIVLPEPSNYERRQIHQIGETMVVGDNIQQIGWNYKESPLDKPVYNTKQFEEIFTEVFAKMGPGPLAGWNTVMGMLYGLKLDVHKKYDYAELCDIRLKKETGKGIDYFRKEGFVDVRLPLAECYDYYHMNILTKARLHMFDMPMMRDGKTLFQNMEAHGIKAIPGWEGRMDEIKETYVALPAWHDNRMTRPNAEFDMYAVNWKTSCRNLGVGGQDNNSYLREIVENWDFDDLSIQINQKTAAEKGLKTGDRILVESITGGTVEGVLKTTNLIRHDCLGFPAQAGRVSPYVLPGIRKGSNYNRLLSNNAGDVLPESGAVPNSVRIKIKKIA